MANGHINKIQEKQGVGRNGPYTMYNVEIDGTWYGCGFKKPNVTEGAYVSFDIIQKGQYKNADNIVAATAAAPAPAATSAAAPAAPVGPAPANKRDISIHYQSCRKDAIQALDALFKLEVVKLPTKKADQYDAYLALLKELTNNFYMDLSDVIDNGGVDVEDMIPSPEDA